MKRKKKRRQDKRTEKEKQVLPVIEFQNLQRRVVSHMSNIHKRIRFVELLVHWYQ